MEMSPFFKADQINTPLLLYHGADDNNSGTYPIQSQRMIQALTGLGKTAVLYELEVDPPGRRQLREWVHVAGQVLHPGAGWVVGGRVPAGGAAHTDSA